ncbi:MAG TPA: endonuclease/exonuclease/phosphatase family protein [Polyangiaceae bacterium]
MRVATYNAGLAVGVLPHAAERAAPVVQALAALPADLICVQEVWLESHWRELADAAAPRLLHALRPPAARQSITRCTDMEARPVLRCVQRHCGATSEAGLAPCAVRHCGHLVTSLSSGCTECLTRDPLRSLAKVTTECAPAGLHLPAARARGGATYVYGGSYGIGLLTSLDVVEEDFLRFESEQLARGVLYARLRPKSATTDLHVFCTHLTADSRSVAYPARAGSWKSEHARQVRELRVWIGQKAGTTAPVLLIGDLNTGPALAATRVGARVPEQYASFAELGFFNPYLDGPNAARCSFCSANTLNGGRGPGGSLIDHILVRGPLRALGIERVLDDPLELLVGGERLSSHLSDHFGLAATVSFTPAARAPSPRATGSL